MLTVIVCAVLGMWAVVDRDIGAQELVGKSACDATILPLLKRYCADCHLRESSEGRWAFDRISEGNQHLHSNLPIVLAGRGGGFLKPGKRLQVGDSTPMCNLHLALAQRMGVKLDRFGDSSGVFPLDG